MAGSRYEIKRNFSLKMRDATCLCANGDAPEGKKQAGDAEQGLRRQGSGPSHGAGGGGCFRVSVSTGLGGCRAGAGTLGVDHAEARL